jgi:hypothetical protein
MKRKHFCSYEHLGGCSDVLNSQVDYFLGEARKKFGRYSYYCTHHTPKASHLSLQLVSFEPRYAKEEV